MDDQCRIFIKQLTAGSPVLIISGFLAGCKQRGVGATTGSYNIYGKGAFVNFLPGATELFIDGENDC